MLGCDGIGDGDDGNLMSDDDIHFLTRNGFRIFHPV